MPRLKQELQTLLENAERVAVLGIGSELRGDDAVGLLVLDYLRRKVGPHSLCGRSYPAGQRCTALPSEKLQRAARRVVKLFNGGTAPENLTGEIRRFKPGHLIMIDAVDMGKKPGTIALVDIKKTENTAFLTHKLPVKLMLDYLAAEMTFTVIFIGIQPKNLDFGVPVSRPVVRAGREVADLLIKEI